METAANAANYVKEQVLQTGSDISKETNKEVAKDPNAPLMTRASAAVDAMTDAKNSASHGAKSEIHKQKATHDV